MCGATPKFHIFIRDFQKEIFNILRRLSLVSLSGEHACEKLLSSVSETALVSFMRVCLTSDMITRFICTHAIIMDPTECIL